MPMPGTMFSASVGRTVEEAGAGVPHGMVRVVQVGEILKAGGRVEFVPEFDGHSGRINRQHVHVVEGGSASAAWPCGLESSAQETAFWRN